LRKCCRLIILILLCCLPASFGLAQSNAATQTPLPTVQIFCDDHSSFDRFPTALTGTIYQVPRPDDKRTGYELLWTTQTGSGKMVIPIPANLNGKLTYSHVSPDGRYVTLLPLKRGTPLVVWKIGTDEFATLPLSNDDVDYLLDMGRERRDSREEQKLGWIDNQHMVMRYFDLEFPWFNYQIAEKTFTVVDQPFGIIEGDYSPLPYPALPVPEGNTEKAMDFSPLRHYVSLASGTRNEDLTFGNQFQIYDMNTLQLAADFKSHSDRILKGKPLWTPDESSFFLYHSLPNSPVFGKNEITRVVVNQGFQENRDLFNALESALGMEINVTYTDFELSSVMSPSGNTLILHVSAPPPNQYYVIAYNLSTGDIRAICDNGIPDTQLSFPVWSPDERYFGYWYGDIGLFDLTDGHRYKVAGEGFVGWISGKIVDD